MRIESVEEWSDAALPQRVRVRIGVVPDTREVFVLRPWVVSRDEPRAHPLQIWSEQQSVREIRLDAARARAERFLGGYRKQWAVNGDGEVQVHLTAGPGLVAHRSFIKVKGVRRWRVLVTEVRGDSRTRHVQLQRRRLWRWVDVGGGSVIDATAAEAAAQQLIAQRFAA